MDAMVLELIRLTHRKGERSLAGYPVPKKDHFILFGVKEDPLVEGKGVVRHLVNELLSMVEM